MEKVSSVWGTLHVDFESRIRELTDEFSELTANAHELEKKIKEDWKMIL